MSEEWSIRAYVPSHRASLFAFFGEVLAGMGYEFLPEGKDSDIGGIESAYTANRGSFHIVQAGGKVHGSVGLRKFSEEIAELKRLYLAAELRGKGIGRELCLQAIRDASALGYKFLRLDTTPKSAAAIALFTKLGFYPIPRYNADPYAELFMELDLSPPRGCPVGSTTKKTGRDRAFRVRHETQDQRQDGDGNGSGYEDMDFGKRTVKVAPSPGWLSTRIEPPSACTNPWQMARPRP